MKYMFLAIILASAALTGCSRAGQYDSIHEAKAESMLHKMQEAFYKGDTEKLSKLGDATEEMCVDNDDVFNKEVCEKMGEMACGYEPWKSFSDFCEEGSNQNASIEKAFQSASE